VKKVKCRGEMGVKGDAANKPQTLKGERKAGAKAFKSCRQPHTNDVPGLGKEVGRIKKKGGGASKKLLKKALGTWGDQGLETAKKFSLTQREYQGGLGSLD